MFVCRSFRCCSLRLLPRESKFLSTAADLGPKKDDSSAVASPAENENIVSGSFFNLIKRYEDVIGLTAVKEAQTRVIEEEDRFSYLQDYRRTKQGELRDVQFKLKEIHSELDKTSRGEDRYLNLLTQEHAVIKEERQMLAEFERVERDERTQFYRLSACLRESHEKERERGERTKYWSIIGSGIGALVGIAGTTINNRLRMRELRDIVKDSSDPAKVKQVVEDLNDMVQTQQTTVKQFVTDLRGILNRDQVLPLSSTQLPQATSPDSTASTILSAIKVQEERLESEMDQVKKMIASEHGYKEAQDGTIVYVGPEMETLLGQTESNLEWKMKLQTLLNVVAVYGAFAITLPVLYALFRG